MHLLQAQAGVVSDGSEAVDLGQTPGDIVILSDMAQWDGFNRVRLRRR